MLSAFLHNESNHDVVVDYTISVEGGNRRSWENIRIEKCDGIGWKNFMRASEVGTGPVGTDLKTTVEVELKWEDLSGGVMQENQVNSKDLIQVEERLGRKLMLMGGQLEHNMGGKLEQMKTFVLAELDQQQQQMKTFVQEELAKVKATSIPECPVCFLQLKPPREDCAVPEGKGVWNRVCFSNQLYENVRPSKRVGTLLFFSPNLFFPELYTLS